MTRKGTQFRSIVLSALSRGDLKVGDKLPSEMELSRKYKFSRSALREGLTSLVEDGILARRRKAGTFIASLSPTPQSSLVALMVPCVNASGFYHQIVRPIEDELHKRGSSMILCNHDNNHDKIKAYALQLCREQVAGIIVVPINHPNAEAASLSALREFEKVGMPFVLIDLAVSLQTLPQYSLVCSQGYAATRRIVRYLSELGHKRIAYIRGLPENFAADQRHMGFMDEMRQQRLEVPDGYVKQLRVESTDVQGRLEVRDFLALHPAPTAVVCTHDVVAINVMEEVKKMGLEIPGDLSVAGFDDLPLAGRADPPLTTVAQPVDEEANLAVAMLFDKIARVQQGERQEFLPCRLVVRQSCGPVKKQESEIPGIHSDRLVSENKV